MWTPLKLTNSASAAGAWLAMKLTGVRVAM